MIYNTINERTDCGSSTTQLTKEQIVALTSSNSKLPTRVLPPYIELPIRYNKMMEIVMENIVNAYAEYNKVHTM